MVKISDVAEYARVSVSTVSRILSQDETFSVSEETISKVNEAVMTLGYKPLRSRKKTKKAKYTLTLIMTVSKEDEELDPYWTEIRVNIVNEASKNDFSIQEIFHLDELRKDLLTTDAYIFLGGTSVETLEDLGLKPSNTVIVDNSSIYTNGFDKVTSDLYEATRINIENLISCGHKKIAFIGGYDNYTDFNTKETHTFDDMRKKAFEEQLKIKGLYNEDLVILGEWRSKHGYEMTKELMSREIKPTAIITASDPLAIGVLHALRELGLQVPNDISIISYDNIESSEFMSPPLSTVDLNSVELGRQSVYLLLQRLEGRKIPVKVIVQSNLIERESIKDIQGGNS